MVLDMMPNGKRTDFETVMENTFKRYPVVGTDRVADGDYLYLLRVDFPKRNETVFYAIRGHFADAARVKGTSYDSVWTESLIPEKDEIRIRKVTEKTVISHLSDPDVLESNRGYIGLGFEKESRAFFSRCERLGGDDYIRFNIKEWAHSNLQNRLDDVLRDELGVLKER